MALIENWIYFKKTSLSLKNSNTTFLRLSALSHLLSQSNAFCLQSFILGYTIPAILDKEKEKDCKSWQIEKKKKKKRTEKKRKMTLMCWRLLCEMPIILSIHSELSKWCMTWMEAGSAEGGLQSCPSGMQVFAQNLPSQTYRGWHFCGADSTLGQRKKERETTHYNKWCYSQFPSTFKELCSNFICKKIS